MGRSHRFGGAFRFRSWPQLRPGAEVMDQGAQRSRHLVGCSLGGSHACAVATAVWRWLPRAIPSSSHSLRWLDALRGTRVVPFSRWQAQPRALHVGGRLPRLCATTPTQPRKRSFCACTSPGGSYHRGAQLSPVDGNPQALYRHEDRLCTLAYAAWLALSVAMAMVGGFATSRAIWLSPPVLLRCGILVLVGFSYVRAWPTRGRPSSNNRLERARR